MQWSAKRFFLHSLILLACFWMQEAAFANVVPLTQDKAFAFSIPSKDQNKLLLQWKIAPGYYLYAKQIKIEFEPKTTPSIQFLTTHSKLITVHGDNAVYSGLLQAVVVLPEAYTKQGMMKVEYQGCSEQGFCYPPMKKVISLSENLSGSFFSLTTLLTDQKGIESQLAGKHLGVTIFIFFCLGLLLSLTPCILPMVPILTSLIAGQKETLTTQKAFFLSSVYILGSAITYAIAGIFSAVLGNSLQVLLQTPWAIMSLSLLFILLALSLLGLYELPLSWLGQNRVIAWSNRQRGGTYIGAFCMGMLSTLIVSPCVTAPLVGVLLYIGQTGNFVLGGAALFVMGIGMGLPLLLIGTTAGKWLPKSGPWMEFIKKLFGLLMIGMAIWLLSRIMPAYFWQIAWGIFLFGVAFFFIWIAPKWIGRYRLNLGLGLLTSFVAVLVILAGTPLSRPLWMNQQSVIAANNTFTIVNSVSELNRQLAIAQATKRPVMLDFYADWCASCIEMDKNVFDLANVQQALKKYVLLRADLTDNNAEDEALLKQYAVIAPPTVLFFNSEGRELPSHRIVGEISADDFLKRLNIVMEAMCNQNMNC